MGADRYAERRAAVSLSEVDFGYRSLVLLAPDELPGAQEGYGGAGWMPSWLVIATEDYLGDPIFTDLADDQLPVFTASHDMGSWEPVQIADSFEGFIGGLEAITALAAGREHPVHPVGLEEHPVPDAEREQLLRQVGALNPRSDLDFWEEWIDPEA